MYKRVSPGAATTEPIIAVYEFGGPFLASATPPVSPTPTSLVLRVLSQTVLADPDFDPDGIFAPHTTRVGRGGLEPPTSALDRSKRCANDPFRSRVNRTSRAELCGRRQP